MSPVVSFICQARSKSIRNITARFAVFCRHSSRGQGAHLCSVSCCGLVVFLDRFALLEHGLEDDEDFHTEYLAAGYVVAPIPLSTCPNMLYGNSVSWKLLLPAESEKTQKDVQDFASRILQPVQERLASSSPNWFLLSKDLLLACKLA